VPRLTGWPGIKELNAFEEAATQDTMLKLIEVIRAQHEALEYAAQQVPDLRGVPGYAAALAKANEVLGVE
jgi:hypothetical protein